MNHTKRAYKQKKIVQCELDESKLNKLYREDECIEKTLNTLNNVYWDALPSLHITDYHDRPQWALKKVKKTISKDPTSLFMLTHGVGFTIKKATRIYTEMQR